MARSPRSGASPSSENIANAKDVQHEPIAGPSRRASSSTTPVNPPPAQRKSTRRQPSTPVPLTSTSVLVPPPPPITSSSPVPVPSPTPPSTSTSKPPPPSRQPVEFKAHALRSVIGGNERTSCPFPSEYGGAKICCLTPEEEVDEVLMAICAACAAMGFRALSPDELASICFSQGWLRPPSAAVEPSTMINNSIRAHQRKCQNLVPPRSPLLAKYQLSGSSVESALEAALHPNAFSGSIRPKGPVWYLNDAADRATWKNPFAGLEMPKPPPRKILPSKPAEKDKGKTKSKTKAVAPVKRIRLVLNNTATGEDVVAESRSVSRSQSRDSTPVVRAKDILDSSDSDTSDSEEASEPEIPSTRIRIRPGPISIKPHSPYRQQQSPFLDLFFPSPNYYPASPATSHLNPSPFPSHSLDNTTWAVRNNQLANLETSSSSSDDELREPDWGASSGILVRADDETTFWAVEDEVSEATDAMKFLFPNTTSSSTVSTDDIELDRLDNQPAPSDTSSLAESSSTATAIFKGHFKAGHEPLALPAWTNPSSPVSSPNMRTFIHLPVDTSPTTQLSKLKDSFDPEDLGLDMMDLDVDDSWLDESGELPVKAEETFSDSELCSTLGDVSTPEHDRQSHTAAWARHAAEAAIEIPSDHFIKTEPEDFPSPATTVETTYEGHHDSRESSSSSSHTPSSKSSDLPPFEIEDSEMDLVMLGPESVSLEEVDRWMIGGKEKLTPRRIVRGRVGHDESRCSGTWGGIGVGNALVVNKPTPRSKSHRRKPRSIRHCSPPSVSFPLDQVEMEIDAIGPEDLELAKAEAEAREEQRRIERQQKADQQRLAIQACRQALRDAGSGDCSPPGDATAASSSPWSDSSGSGFDMQSAMSPLALQSISSTLSLGSSAIPLDSVDPKALTSPPVGGMIMLDEVLSQAEVDAVMNSFTAPQPPLPAFPLSAVIAPPHPTPIPTPTSTPTPSSIIPKPVTSKPKVKVTLGPSRTQSPVVGGVKSEIETTKDATKPKAKSTSPSLPTSVPNLSTATSSTAASTPAPTPSPAPTPAKPTQRLWNHKVLMEGVAATVIDSIPIYIHQHAGKEGTCIVLRRLDTDFINGTSLLCALGVPLIRANSEYLNAPSQWLASHRTVPTISPHGIPYSPGVAGVWVPLVEAQEYARKLGLKDRPALSNILRNDLFNVFAVVAKLKQCHSPQLVFGSDFDAGYNGSAPSSSSSSSAASTSNSSKSTPSSGNLGTSLPAIPNHLRPANAAATQKTALVRSAPSTPHENCPLPKRRRATIVGASSPLLNHTAASPTVGIGGLTKLTPHSTSKPPPSVATPAAKVSAQAAISSAIAAAPTGHSSTTPNLATLNPALKPSLPAPPKVASQNSRPPPPVVKTSTPAKASAPNLTASKITPPVTRSAPSPTDSMRRPTRASVVEKTKVASK